MKQKIVNLITVVTIMAFLRPVATSAGADKPCFLRPLASAERPTPRRFTPDDTGEGITYEEAMEWRVLLAEQNMRAPRGFWNDRKTARNMILAALDTITEVTPDGEKSFKKARLDGNIKTMAELYRKFVKKYTPKNQKKYKAGGQLTFFREVGKLGAILSRTPDYLEGPRPIDLLQLAVPELVSTTNPDALDPYEIERNYWDDPNTAIRHILKTLYTIDGFEKAFLDQDIKTMADLYRDNVKTYPGGQTKFFIARGRLGSLMLQPRPYLSAKESAAALIHLAIPGLIDDRNPDALMPNEVEYYYWNDEKRAVYRIQQALDTLDGFSDARSKGEIKIMADIYRAGVLNKPGGQIRFFREAGGLAGLMTHPREYLPKRDSAAALLYLAVPDLIDAKNPDALQPSEVEAPPGILARLARMETRRRLVTLLRRPDGSDWLADEEVLPRLKGRDLGVTSPAGTINLYIEDLDMWVVVQILGFREKGWRARIKDCRVKNNSLYEIEVELKKRSKSARKGRKKTIVRTLQVGAYSHIVERGDKTVRMLILSESLGVVPLGRLMCNPSNFKWSRHANEMPFLEDYCVGTTNKDGRIRFSPMPNFLFDWSVFRHKKQEDREGWKGTIVASDVRGGYFRFLVKWVKEDKENTQDREDRGVRYRIYQIGPYEKMLMGQNKRKGSRLRILRIIPVKKFLRKADKEDLMGSNGIFDPDKPGVVDLVSPELDPTDAASYNEMRQRLDALMESMTPRQRGIALSIIRYEIVDDMVVPNATLHEVAAVKRMLRDALRDFVDFDLPRPMLIRATDSGI